MTQCAMDTNRKRAIISWAYPGDKWLLKVTQMSPEAVHTTYMRLLNNGKLKGISSNVQFRKH